MTDTLRKSLIIIVMVTIRILTMFVAFKFLSNHFGPAGFGLLSQVTAVAALFSTFAGGGLSNGLVKEVAGARDDIERLKWLKSGLNISLASGVLLGVVSFGLYLFGSRAILDDQHLAWVFVLIGLAQIFTGVGNTALAYLSGISAIGSVALAGIIGAVLSVVLIIAGSYFFNFSGAVAGCAVLALSPSIFATLLLARRRINFFSKLLKIGIEQGKIRRLLHYSLAMIVTAASVPLALIFIRLRLSQVQGWEVVGHWQAVSRIGDAYIQVFGALFASILLPRLAALSGQRNLKVTFAFMPPFMMLFVFGGFVFWMFSQYILTLAYSANFASSDIYVAPQLLADFLKILSSFFIYRFLALGRPYLQAVGEVVQACFMFASFLILLPQLGGLAAVWSYAIGAGFVLIFALIATAVDGSHRQDA
jgi:O-antigen/teichoic acid export membrane protein